MSLSPALSNLAFWLALALCAIAQVAILRSTFRSFAARRAVDDSLRDTPQLRRGPELAWALLPPLALILLFAGTWKSMHTLSDSGNGAPRPPSTYSESPTLLAEVTVPEQISAARRAEPVRLKKVVTALEIPVDYSVPDDEELPQR